MADEQTSESQKPEQAEAEASKSGRHRAKTPAQPKAESDQGNATVVCPVCAFEFEPGTPRL